MAKATVNGAAMARKIIDDVNVGIFAPVYLLMGEEPFYVDMAASAIVDKALDEDQRDFNQLVAYGADTSVSDVISNARRYPMFADRTLVVVREAQALAKIEDLAVYTDSPLDTTVLVLVYRGNLDKRKSLYKSISKNGMVLESTPVRDYEMTGWISEYYAGRGLSIEPQAAALLAESVGTDLGKVAVETDKLLKNLPEGCTKVTLHDIEANVGISREFSIFELTRQLSSKDAPKALRTAAYIGASAKFAMPMATAALFTHFNRILRYGALLQSTPNPSSEDKTKILGVNPYFFREYDTAVRNYPLKRCMGVIALIRDYDFKGKGGSTGEASPQELLIELVTKILYS